MKVDFRDSFARDLKGVKDQGLLNRVKEQIEVAEKAETFSDIPNLKKLKGGRNYFRLRVGDFRIGLSFENNTLMFVRFLNRKDIYQSFP